MVKKYRVAIVGGAGSWGRHYTRAYVARPDCAVVLVERAEERGRIFAAHYGIETVYRSVEELLAREVPDVVSAILPVVHTHDVVIACAEAGVKVVSCEKPIDCDLARAAETGAVREPEAEPRERRPAAAAPPAPAVVPVPVVLTPHQQQRQRTAAARRRGAAGCSGRTRCGRRRR